MCGWEDVKYSFEDIHQKWFDCFNHYLKKLKFNDDAVSELFYEFDMSNWKALWRESTEYKNHNKEDLIIEFCSGCYYISDRMRLGRLFRTHWFFRNVFNDELNKVRFPTLYKDDKKE